MKNMLLAASILTALSSSCFATTIVHTGLDGNRAMTIEINAGGSAVSVGAGVGVLLVDGITRVDVVCVNLFQGISVNVSYAAQAIAAGLYDADGPAAAYLAQHFLPSVATRTAGAALQLAVWDLIHDGGDGFASGSVRSTANTDAAVLTQARSWVQMAVGESGVASVFTAAPGARVFQQQMFLAGGGTQTSQTPEPGSLTLVAVGVVALGLGSWRSRRG